MSRLQSWNMITLFCILIFGFTAATLIKPDDAYSEAENRTLEQMPEVSAEAVLSGEFEEDYETYLTDQFVLRDKWIGLKTSVERALLKQESKDIYFADDGYLIEKHTGSFTSDTARANIASLARFVQNYQEQFADGHMTVMIVPNAVDILRDKLPKYASPYDEEEYLAQLAAALPEDVWFDAGEVLRAHLDEELYYRTDHHWKTGAAFHVCRAWMEAQEASAGTENQSFTAERKEAQDSLPDTSPGDSGAEERVTESPATRTISQEDFEIETVTDSFEGTIQSKLGIQAQPDSIELYKWKSDPLYTVHKNGAEKFTYSIYDYTALDTKSKYDIFFGGNDARVTIRTEAGTGRRILILKDSYAHCFVPFLLESYDEIELVDIRYYNQKLSDLIAAGDYTDLLVLYNAAGFAEETGIARILY